MQQDDTNEGHQILPVDTSLQGHLSVISIIHSNVTPTPTLTMTPTELQNSIWSLEARSEYLISCNMHSKFVRIELHSCQVCVSAWLFDANLDSTNPQAQRQLHQRVCRPPSTRTNARCRMLIRIRGPNIRRPWLISSEALHVPR
jgi:hypothetical protein